MEEHIKKKHEGEKEEEERGRGDEGKGAVAGIPIADTVVDADLKVRAYIIIGHLGSQIRGEQIREEIVGLLQTLMISFQKILYLKKSSPGGCQF